MNELQVVVVLGALLAGLISGASAEDASAPAPDLGWGSIDGQFILNGPHKPQLRFNRRDPQLKDWEICGCQEMPDETLVVDPATKGIANIFVYLKKAPGRIHPELKAIPAKTELTAQGCRYVPHCGILRVGQDLNVKFTGEVAHNAHFHPMAMSMPGTIFPANDPAGIDYDVFDVPQPIPMKVVCDIHPWMDGYWTVLDHPYAAITDKEGRFKLEQVPVGEHKFCAWHERCGYITREYQVIVTSNCKTVLPIEKVAAVKLAKK